MVSLAKEMMHTIIPLTIAIASLNEYRDDHHREAACLKVAGEVLLYASIVPLIEQQMNKTGLWNYYINVEMPALRTMLHVLLNGVLIDHDQLANIREDLLVNCFCLKTSSI